MRVATDVPPAFVTGAADGTAYRGAYRTAYRGVTHFKAMHFKPAHHAVALPGVAP
jgi:hypothetical protein